MVVAGKAEAARLLLGIVAMAVVMAAHSALEWAAK